MRIISGTARAGKRQDAYKKYDFSFYSAIHPRRKLFISIYV